MVTKDEVLGHPPDTVTLEITSDVNCWGKFGMHSKGER